MSVRSLTVRVFASIKGTPDTGDLIVRVTDQFQRLNKFTKGMCELSESATSTTQAV